MAASTTRARVSRVLALTIYQMVDRWG